MSQQQDIKQLIELNNELKTRREKLVELKRHGYDFPNNFRRDSLSSNLHYKYDDKNRKQLDKLNINVSVAGRMITRRIMGKASFATLQDMSGRIQIYISCYDLSKSFYEKQFKKWDLGDILGVKGKLFKTKTDELTIYCYEVYLLTKSLRPLPDKYFGLIDQEIRYRQRYLDLIVNDRSRNIFMIRSRLLSALRNFMIKKDFIEVETPMMQVIPGGAAAKPFITHHNTLDIDMYLRIAPELYLKRLVIGGFERVFEINRNFRNEGISARHNPEFTMMELYMAYVDYKDLMILTEELFKVVTKEVLGTTQVKYGKYLFDFEIPFIRMTMKEAIIKYTPKITLNDLDDISKLEIFANSMDIKIKKEWGVGRLQSEIFENLVENCLIQPTFITEYPVEVSPLARRNDKNPFITDRFEFFIGGYEIGNGFSELNDAEDQAQRFTKQVFKKNNSKDKSIFFDNDYIIALEHGLPPTAGLGIGIDRMIMLLTDSHFIRDVILFPALRPNK
ncbi:Lysine--tRNA ligase [Candidatus Arsenophonus lipoptenae]|uniref:Lysine--tRNA ligase n=1 Tax=Candidatus Arsenophonus lipoptenae TaxID=634113 RepID=A0A120HPT2_9GAMM|nr:lysine--tRNA ligase [Candidatus Arsenophonus lipoptenae]AMA64694.1 Lysine--tRNA ligase [Candidatus Arsenophonus lipoptenae]